MKFFLSFDNSLQKNNQKNFNNTNNTNNNNNISESDSDSEEINQENLEELKHEGYLYKITRSNKLKKLWFKLIHKDLYYFKDKDLKIHKGMHNLSGVFVNEEENLKYEDKDLLCFSITYPKKIRNYYHIDEVEFRNWIKIMEKVTGYCSITEKYEIKVNCILLSLKVLFFIEYSRTRKIWVD